MLQREDTAGCGLGIVCIHKKGVQAGIGKKTGKVSSKRGFAFSTFGRDNGKYFHFAHSLQYANTPVYKLLTLTQGLKIPVSLVRFESGHHLFREPAQKAGFAFRESDSPSNCVRLFAVSGSPFGASAPGALFNACGVSPSPGTTYSENPPKRRVLLFGARLSIELCSIIRRQRLTPSGPARGMPLVALPNIAALSPVIKLPYCRE